MHKQKAVYLLVVMVVLVVSALMSSITIAQSGTNSALVTETPEQSNLIIDCSFGERGKEDCGIKHFFELANNIMRLLLWVAVTGAGILIFYKGTKLAVNVFTKGGHQGARKEVQDALKATLTGLLFILSAYLIVKAGFDIIGYNLNDGDPFKYDESSLHDPAVSRASPPTYTPPPPSSPPVSPPGAGQAPGSPDFPRLQGSNIPHKTPDLNGCGGSECFVARELFERLDSLHTATSVEWWVTESCPPTMGHRHSCHRTTHCDCVDVNFRTAGTNNSNHNPTKQEVLDFIQKAHGIGLYAVYEVPNSGAYTSLRRSISEEVVSGGKIIHVNVPTPHFSIYESRAIHDRR